MTVADPQERVLPGTPPLAVACVRQSSHSARQSAGATAGYVGGVSAIIASARFPENTLASFEAAIRDGAEGIESDVHVSADNVVVMFHDPALERTTNGKGQIKDLNWHGADGMAHLRTIKTPQQAIPTFAETIALLMRPENMHAKFNVDVKVQNEPERLFALMHAVIAAQAEWETALAPRILLGLWHPRFIAHAKARLPYCQRSFIGVSPYTARKYFWRDCQTFSVAFGALTTADGQRFRRECKDAGKRLLAVRWGVDAILTDETKKWLDMRAALKRDYDKIGAQYGRWFLWTTPMFYTPVMMAYGRQAQIYLERIAGPFDAPVTMAAVEA
ncbi:hypothetical protein C0993_002301 [Termitomyces sp. T159_Od127]|nr:hypothetical protein C0993_002301 [Termitomyces sp. T159_Od127]